MSEANAEEEVKSCCDDYRCDDCPKWVRRDDATLADVARAAIEHEASRKARAAARRELSKQRRLILEETGEFWSPKDRCDDDGEIFSVHNAREAANATFRRTASALRRAIKRAAP